MLGWPLLHAALFLHDATEIVAYDSGGVNAIRCLAAPIGHCTGQRPRWFSDRHERVRRAGRTRRSLANTAGHSAAAAAPASPFGGIAWSIVSSEECSLQEARNGVAHTTGMLQVRIKWTVFAFTVHRNPYFGSTRLAVGPWRLVVVYCGQVRLQRSS